MTGRRAFRLTVRWLLRQAPPASAASRMWRCQGREPGDLTPRFRIERITCRLDGTERTCPVTASHAAVIPP